MGCRCCKMIHSYFFDPVQVPSPGYVNEVNSCKAEEEDTDKLKSKLSSEVQVHKSDLQGEGLRRTLSKSRTAGPQALGWPHQEQHPQEDTGGGHCGEKAIGAINGIGPTAALQPPGEPGPQQGNSGSWTTTANRVFPPPPFLEGRDTRETDWVLQASEETRVSPKAECPALDVQGHVLRIPAPDYPPCWGSAGDNVDHGGKDYPFTYPAEGPLEAVHPAARGPGAHMSFCAEQSWGSLAEAVAAEALSVYLKEEDPVPAAPGADPTDGWEGALGRGRAGDGSGDTEDEDAAVAEALAALEAATAGEDVDEVD